MPSESRRILDLALENLEFKKKQIEEEIAQITQELRSRFGRKRAALKAGGKAETAAKRRRSRFSREERARRSQRMKAYWDKWRKERGRQK
jgi:hypothetical protein